ncbi:hypothetical protein GCM10011415_19110 [Salipiger pallidus]|uniref:Nudix hydrolase domain-containing protein n=1 Tax=Salipiger pallidus TaxID=1775170 RepID=A0A8J2ZJU1_9RHOB|nr:NUDIX hydrolase [Salipiger pallidus]GGG71441.1 hypothetical protein GCM10011415_19110 [Salipiger pallidus]
MTTPKLAALAVVLKGDQVLLVRRRNPPDAGLWGYPGGHVNFGETTAEAAVRELFEETGVIAAPVRSLMGLDTFARTEAGVVTHHFYLVAVQCSHVSGTPQGQDDVFEAAWHPQEDVLHGRLPLSREVDRVLHAALAPGDAPL